MEGLPEAVQIWICFWCLQTEEKTEAKQILVLNPF